MPFTPTVQFSLSYLEVVDLYSTEEISRLQNSVFIPIHIMWNEGSCLLLSVNYVFWVNYGKKSTVVIDFITIKSVLSKKEEDNQVYELWKMAI